jgi:hypothetical protein
VTAADDPERKALLHRGFVLEYVTLSWNVAGIVVLALASFSARSVALAGFGLDSLIEIVASTVVIWELSGTGEERQRRGLRLIGFAFAALAAYLLAQSTVVLVLGYHSRHSVPGIIWSAATAAVMFTLAAGKARTGRVLDNPVLQTEGRVTMIDAILATAVLLGLILNAALSWWWADPAVGYVLVFYAAREARSPRCRCPGRTRAGPPTRPRRPRRSRPRPRCPSRPGLALTSRTAPRAGAVMSASRTSTPQTSRPITAAARRHRSATSSCTWSVTSRLVPQRAERALVVGAHLVGHSGGGRDQHDPGRFPAAQLDEPPQQGGSLEPGKIWGPNAPYPEV